MRERIILIQAFLAILLFFIIFFGISFILNMLLRSTWIMSILYPVVIYFFIHKVPIKTYVQNPGEAFSQAFENILQIQLLDAIILLTGFLGTITSGLVIKILRRSGYQMF